MRTLDIEDLVLPLDPIYAGVTYGIRNREANKHHENNAKYNRDMAKIIDRCWNCPRFGMGIADQDRKKRTHCQRCKASMLKALESSEAHKNKK